jgi:hypothetical protein
MGVYKEMQEYKVTYFPRGSTLNCHTIYVAAPNEETALGYGRAHFGGGMLWSDDMLQAYPWHEVHVVNYTGPVHTPPPPPDKREY